MAEMHVNYLAVAVAGIVIFGLGSLWYSPVLFAKKWMQYVGKTAEELQKSAKPINYLLVFVAGVVTAYVLANVVNFAGASTVATGAEVGCMCWLGFAALTSYPHAIFAGRPLTLWAIDTGYNLVSFVIAGGMLAVWR